MKIALLFSGQPRNVKQGFEGFKYIQSIYDTDVIGLLFILIE